MVLTREERESLVLDLYNQGKNYREIAEEARISPRDIGVIVNKAIKEKETMEGKQQNKDNNSQRPPSLSAQAYALFLEGKTPIQVAIELNLREAEATKSYKEHWK